jgi:hypothetical protein
MRSRGNKGNKGNKGNNLFNMRGGDGKYMWVWQVLFGIYIITSIVLIVLFIDAKKRVYKYEPSNEKRDPLIKRRDLLKNIIMPIFMIGGFIGLLFLYYKFKDD